MRNGNGARTSRGSSLARSRQLTSSVEKKARPESTRCAARLERVWGTTSVEREAVARLERRVDVPSKGDLLAAEARKSWP